MIGLSSARLHNLWNYWSQISQSCRTLGEQFKFIDLFPDFMPQFIILTKQFTQFNKFAIVIFNSIHPDNELREPLNRSAIWQSADSFIRGWYEFIQQLNDVINIGVQQFFPILRSSLDQTKNSILNLANLYFVGCLTSNVTPEAFTEIRQEFQELRLLVSTQTPDSYLNVCQFLNSVQLIASQIYTTFLSVSPRFTFSSGELIHNKIQVKIALKELLELAGGLLQFEEATVTVRQLTFQFNDELMDVIHSLQLPWNITLTSPNERVILIHGIEPTDQTAFLTPPEKKSALKSPRRRC
jgi:hypothetical protein